VQQRERQLDAISTILVLALLIILVLVLYFLSIGGAQLPSASPLAQYVPRVLLGGFTIMLLLYLADQRRRLHLEVTGAVADTERARSDLATTVRSLTFSHDAASVLGAEGVDVGLRRVLADAGALFNADAAAVLGPEFDNAFIAEGVSEEEAERAFVRVALEAAGRPGPLHIQSLGAGRGQAIAVPLRVAGELRFVLCVWRRGEPFESVQPDSLGLMGRMVELAIERGELLEEARAQLEGTLDVLQYLVADKRPNYSRHVMRVADMAAEIGRRMAVLPRFRKSLRLAGLIHDVGIMDMPSGMADANRELTSEEQLVMRQHPRISSEIALAAHFDASVQVAVAGHHERLDGSGYPKGLSGDEISLGARILAVCEVFDSMAERAYHGGPTGIADAIEELHQNAGVLYAAAAVRVLVETIVPQNRTRSAIPDLEDSPIHLTTDTGAIAVA
jgi:hypothetical protein